MKTSNKLLLLLFAVFFLAILGSAMILGAEFDKINKADPFYGYTTEAVTDFGAVILQNQYAGLVQVQPGEAFEIKLRNSRSDIQWVVQDDTLVVTFPKTDLPTYYSFEAVAGRQYPDVYIIAPRLRSVHTEGIVGKLHGWQQAALHLMIEGATGGLLLAGNTLEDLTASVAHGSTLQVNADNQVRQAWVSVQDSSTFMTEQHSIDSLRMRVDSTAQVRLPGRLLSQVGRAGN